MIAFFIIIIAIIVIAVLVVSSDNKKQADIEAKERTDQKNNQRVHLVIKFRSNEVVNAWAKEVSQKFLDAINIDPYKSYTMDIKADVNEVYFGAQLQEEYYPAIKELKDKANKKILYTYSLARNNLPDLETLEQRSLFAYTMGEMIGSYLAVKNVKVFVNKAPARLVYDSYNSSWKGESFWQEYNYICQVSYKYKESENKW